MGYRTLIQLAMIIGALFLIFTVILPQFESVKEVEAEAAEYQKAVANAASYNSELASLKSRKNSFTSSEMERLEAYLPASVDELSVLSDIKTAADASGATIIGMSAMTTGSDNDSAQPEVTYDENGEPVTDNMMQYTDFVVQAGGYYSTIKDFLEALEYNDYQFNLVSATINPVTEIPNIEGDLSAFTDPTNPQFTYSLVLRVFSFNSN